MAAWQDNLNRLTAVATSWNLFLKCVVSRFCRHFAGWNNSGYDFNNKINNTALVFATSYRDLRVTVDKDLKFHCHMRDFVIYYVLL